MAQASGTDDKRRANVTDSVEIAGHKVLLITISRWLSANFDLPLVLDPPRLARVPRAKMVALVHVPKDHPAGVPTDNAQSGTLAPKDIVALRRASREWEPGHRTWFRGDLKSHARVRFVTNMFLRTCF
jgi:hypothetical protein